MPEEASDVMTQRPGHDDASWSRWSSIRRAGAICFGEADGRGVADAPQNVGSPKSLDASANAWASIAGVGFTRPFAGNGASGGGSYSAKNASAGAGRRGSVGDFYNVEHLEKNMQYVAVADANAAR